MEKKRRRRGPPIAVLPADPLQERPYPREVQQRPSEPGGYCSNEYCRAYTTQLRCPRCHSDVEPPRGWPKPGDP